MDEVKKDPCCVEAEEDVYSYTPANNGASPLWCMGSTSLVRVGENIFASGIETLPDTAPLNNCVPRLFQRDHDGWHVMYKDVGRTREPCPLAAAADGRLYLSLNETLAEKGEYDGPAQPKILEFQAGDMNRPPRVLIPQWQGTISFHGHSYRSLVSDNASGDLLLFWSTAYDKTYWTFRDGSGRWVSKGELQFPWGGEYPTPCPIRLCYPAVALKNRAAHYFGMSDIHEPNPIWSASKKEITGRDWDYDMRRLFYAWTPDITRGEFSPWLEVASCEATAGNAHPCDSFLDDQGNLHILWTEIRLHLNERFRQAFFKGEKQRYSLNYAVLRDGKIIRRRELAAGGDEAGPDFPAWGRFHATKDGRIFVFYTISGAQEKVRNLIAEITADGTPANVSDIPLQHPFTRFFFTATPRAGSPRSDILEVFGECAGLPSTMRYARIRIP